MSGPTETNINNKMAGIQTQIETLSAKLYDDIYSSTNDAKTAKMMADVFKNNVHNLWNTMIELSSVKDTGNNTTNTTIQSPSTSQLHQTCCKNYNGIIAMNKEKEKKEAYELRKKYNNKYKYLPVYNKPCSTTCNLDRYLSGLRKTNGNLTLHSILPRVKLIKLDNNHINPQGSSLKDGDEIKNEENSMDSNRNV